MAQPGRTTPAAAGTGLRTVDALARAAGTSLGEARRALEAEPDIPDGARAGLLQLAGLVTRRDR